MTNRKSTKRALLGSVTAMVLCLAMLVGATFAWFTDTASTGVNKITSGNLDVEIVNKEGEKVTSLKWVKAEGAAAESVLWEPGCRYQLEPFQIVNNGNLALKYKLVITGLTGDADLLKVIQFTYTIGDETLDLAGEGHLTAKGTDGAKSQPITITGAMDTAAGNEYMNKKLDNISITVVATQDTVESDSYSKEYDANAQYPEVKQADSLEEVFGDINFGFNNTATEDVVLDGQGSAAVNEWTDAYLTSNTTIKGVTFRNGATFNVKSSDVTVTLEDCTFYACDQDAAAAALGITNKLTGEGNGSRNNIMTNSGAGMCLNLEQLGGTTGVKLIVKNCTFVGENDETLPVYGDKYDGQGKVIDQYKKRGHAIALNAISGGGTAGTLESLLIDGCTIDGVRGNAIQLYGSTGDITIQNTKINSWGVNSGAYTVNGAAKDANSAAIRGDFVTGGNRTLTISNVYFGLDENKVEGHAINHVNVGSYPGNTDGTRTAGAY